MTANGRRGEWQQLWKVIFSGFEDGISAQRVEGVSEVNFRNSSPRCILSRKRIAARAAASDPQDTPRPSLGASNKALASFTGLQATLVASRLQT